MRIVQLVAGAGGMYCGSCLHANALAAALRAEGHDAVLVPLYTPLRTDDADQSIDRVGLGGINVFLQQWGQWFAFLPRPLRRWLDSPRLLALLARRAGTTRPQRLGPLTLSILRGEEGRQRRELADLVDWVGRALRPDVVHLSTGLLAGAARTICQSLNVPVVATLSGEDAFLEGLPAPFATEARDLLRRRCEDLAAIVALNHYYADFMASYLTLDRRQIAVVPPGVNLAGYPSQPKTATQRDKGGGLRTIGYFGRICREKGLHLLVEAMGVLARHSQLPPLRLRAAGYFSSAERPYLAEVQIRARQLGVADRFEFSGELDRGGKIAFLREVDVFSAPSLRPESKGLTALEAWACGTTTALPKQGAFAELNAATGGGLLHEPNSAESLAAAIKRLLVDDDLRGQCGRQAHEAAHQDYSAPVMARRMIAVYQQAIGR